MAWVGEHNQLGWHGRGLCGCISPWNFPAIFVGQIVAALVAGNSVVAAGAAYQPGLPHGGEGSGAGGPAVLQFVPGEGARCERLGGSYPAAAVLFTGSALVAKRDSAFRWRGGKIRIQSR